MAGDLDLCVVLPHPHPAPVLKTTELENTPGVGTGDGDVRQRHRRGGQQVLGRHRPAREQVERTLDRLVPKSPDVHDDDLGLESINAEPAGGIRLGLAALAPDFDDGVGYGFTRPGIEHSPGNPGRARARLGGQRRRHPGEQGGQQDVPEHR